MTTPKPSHRPRLGSRWTDFLVVVACCVVFGAVISLAKRTTPKHAPTGGIVHEVDATLEQVARVAAYAPLDLRQRDLRQR
jgi:hypothetical protein